jgi:phosphatidylglycerophosphate synthase
VNKLIESNVSASASAAPPRLLIVGACDVELWSLTPAERHRRAFARVGVVPDTDDDGQGPVVAVRADYLLGPDLVAAIAERQRTVLTSADGKVAVAAHLEAEDLESVLQLLRGDEIDRTNLARAGLTLVGPVELGSAYDNTLRKRATPFVLSYEDTTLEVLEKTTFGAAYKGATDFVTKWCWPRPARWATRWAAARGISPNSVTTASLVLVLLAMWLFAEGHFMSAIPLAWAMTFLDTVDGKLARVTLTSSAWGNIYDHGIDLIHPPFWWWAWYVGVQPLATPALAPALEPALWIILAGYLLGRLLEGLFVVAFKIESHIWQPIDYFFRTITARRNPNLAILTVATLAGRPDIGLVAVAAWTIASLVFHTVRLIQAIIVRARGGHIVSWLKEAG